MVNRVLNQDDLISSEYGTLTVMNLQMQKELREIRFLLQEIRNEQNNNSREVLNVKEAAKFLNMAPSTLYNLTSRNSIPVMRRKGSRTIKFHRDELLEWVRQGNKVINIDMQLQNARTRR